MRFAWLVLVMLAACGEPFLDYPTKVEYAPQSDGVLTLTGPIITERVPTTLEASARNDSAVFVVDYDAASIHYGQNVAAAIAYDDEALTLSAFPVTGCGTLLAFAVLDSVRDVNSERLGRTRAFDDAFELRDDDTTFAALRPALIRAGYELGSIAGATLFAVPCAL